jgi:hypothetical protein
MVNSKRTCNLILGVGDGKLPAFRSVQYSGSIVRFFDDKNMQPVYDWHPRMENVVYYGMDWLCPGYTKERLLQRVIWSLKLTLVCRFCQNSSPCTMET